MNLGFLRQWFLKRKLSAKFLLLTLPLIALSALVFIFVLIHTENQKSQAANEAFANELGVRDARFLSESIWNIERKRVVSTLISESRERRVICVLVHDNGGWNDGIKKGQCQNLRRYFHVTAPIVFKNETLGSLSLWYDVSVNKTKLYRDVRNLALLILVLLLILVFCVVIGFRLTIIKPLSIVSQSLMHYKKSGERTLVNWDTGDELGVFIKEYNFALQREAKTENALVSAKDQAETMLAHLQQTQQSLVQSEKLASLGSLVAGIAHEINTPLGNSLTVASALEHKLDSFHRVIKAGGLKKSVLMTFLDETGEATDIIVRSLHTAAEQIQNFKQVAVDQTSSQRRCFDLKEVVDEVVSTLKPRIKHTLFQFQIKVETGINLESYPGPIGQVISNLFNNALMHAFDGREKGVMVLEAMVKNEGEVSIVFSDDGKGIADAHLKKVYDPFFTTKMGEGGSGLGMNLVYNIVTGTLGGTIEISSQEGVGTEIQMVIPLLAPQQND